MDRIGILNEFGVRLEGMNAKHRRLALPAVDAPGGYTDSQRIGHIRVLLDGIEADMRRGRRVDDRYLTELGAYALAWIDAQREQLRATRPTDEIPIVPRDGGPHGEF